MRYRVSVWLLGIAAVATLLYALVEGDPEERLRPDPGNAPLVALGTLVYAQHCASCHGAQLEGQPNWQDRRPDGRLPAPPHNAEGHTWHHPDDQLIAIIREGMAPFAPAGYVSDMPAFKGTLSERETVAVLAYIKSTWPATARERQARASAPANKR